MKYIKIIVVICAILAFSPMISFSQNSALIEINAIVVGSENEPIEGAAVRSGSISAVTDGSGAFSIQVPENSSLTISATGYTNSIVIATTNLEVISLEVDEITMVQLAFRNVAHRDLVGAVSVVDGADLLRKNYTSNPIDGLVSEIGGFNGNSIWGREGYLIVVDGIPRDINNFRTTEIDQITVLKGAGAVALYGTHATNGVIYITTKRGQVSEQQVDVRMNTGIAMPKRYANYLNSAEYMTLYNEARLNDGIGHLYSENVIAATASGSNKYRHPDMDFYSSDYLNSYINRSDVTTEIYGGDKSARYYTNIGYMRQGSLLNFGEGANGYDQRFNLRGNVDINLTNWLTAAVDAAAILSEGRGPQTNYWEQASTVRPNRFSPLYPVSMIDMNNDANRIIVENTDNLIDGKYVLGGSQLDQTNPFADIYAGGYNKAISRQFMFNTNIDADLNAITPGLAFRTKMGIDYNTSYNQGYNHQYRVFEPKSWDANNVALIDTLVFEGQDHKDFTQYINDSWYQQLVYFSGQLDYKRTINDQHNLFTMLVANGYQYSISGAYHKNNNTNLGYYLGYNYLHKYYLDFNSSLMYSTRLASGNRMYVSPVLSLGWRISDETFMQGLTFIDNLKLNSTIGRIYSDQTIQAVIDETTYTHYLYDSSFKYRNTQWYAWSAEMGIDVTAALRSANPDLKAPHRDELTVGFEATLFNRLLFVDANYFSITNKGGIIQATTLYPSYLQTGWPESSFVPYVNYNEERRTGYDFNLRLRQQAGNTNLIFGLVGTFYDTEILTRSDIYDYDYQEREGKALDGVWGLQAAGFFADQADIDNSPAQKFGEVKPGDIKYVDRNNDGVIDVDDEIFLGRGGWFGSPNTLGVNVTAQWKNFTIYAQGVGRWGGYGIRNRTTDWVYGDRKYSDVVNGRWAYYTDPNSGETIDTRATANYPRLTTSSSQNNFRNSDFWFYNNDRFDISRIQLTYSLPQSIIGNTFFRNVDIYLLGSNLFTIAAEREYLETNVGQAPQMRFYNVGLTAAF
jgi:TonB-linked SusC/RagA family outer membrane protein